MSLKKEYNKITRSYTKIEKVSKILLNKLKETYLKIKENVIYQDDMTNQSEHPQRVLENYQKIYNDIEKTQNEKLKILVEIRKIEENIQLSKLKGKLILAQASLLNNDNADDNAVNSIKELINQFNDE